ncbi:uncharacterized protein [Gossypium hirsutum]|uniref:Uncharacterized protein isoform X2 n=1 Tax=Gossypium hirsutum TaxID=3635 RepID=A0ABM2YPD1_GOSHI|nr:uncharacterized protein LOC107890061 isoform X2 [Gossypium hirsutum]
MLRDYPRFPSRYRVCVCQYWFWNSFFISSLEIRPSNISTCYGNGSSSELTYVEIYDLGSYIGPFGVSFNENQTSCQRDPCEGKNKKKFIAPVVVSIIAVVALVILLSLLIIFHKIKRRKQTVGNTTPSNK